MALLRSTSQIPIRYRSDKIITADSIGRNAIINLFRIIVLLAYHNKKITAQNAELKRTLDVVSTDAQENGKAVKSLQPQLAAAAQERDTLKKQNSDYFYQVSSLNTDKNTLQTLLDEARTTAATLNKKLETIEQEHEAKINKINAYHMQQTHKLAALLDDDIRQTKERFNFLNTLDPRAKTPVVLEEMKILSMKIQHVAHFSGLLLKSVQS